MKKTYISLLLGMLVVTLTPIHAQSTPANFVGLNFSPITNSTSYNYNWATGAMTIGTATATVSSTQGVMQNSMSDPKPPDPNGFGTFIGTARPVQSPTGGGSVLFEQSVCTEGSPACLFDGSLTFGDMVMYSLRGATLDQITNLQTDYYVEHGCFGGGSPRFQIFVTNAAGMAKNIFVYLGTPPAFADCPPPNMWIPTGNFASDSAGTRWDTSQLCPGTFYNTYTGAITCADTLGYTINAILLVTDGGWSGSNAGTPTGQTFLFRNIEVDQVTRFPRD